MTATEAAALKEWWFSPSIDVIDVTANAATTVAVDLSVPHVVVKCQSFPLYTKLSHTMDVRVKGLRSKSAWLWMAELKSKGETDIIVIQLFVFWNL